MFTVCAADETSLKAEILVVGKVNGEVKGKVPDRAWVTGVEEAWQVEGIHVT